MRGWRLAATIGLPLVLVVVLLVVLRKGVPSRTILEIDLRSGVIDYIPRGPLARALLSKRATLRDVVDTLGRATADERIVGLVATLGSGPMGVGTAQELRDAIRRFRGAKKFAVAFADTFGEFGPANTAYYLATAFDEIHIQPSGDVGLIGLELRSMFLKGTLDKVGVRFRGDQRYEHKTALNTFTQTKFTPAHRESYEAVKKSLFGQLVRGIATGRKLTPEQVRALVDRGPLLGKEALTARLVDGLSYRDQVYAGVKKRAGEGANLLYWNRYLDLVGRPNRSGKTIALVYGVGAVTRGRSQFHPLGGATMGSDTVARALHKAIKDESVKAIVFRVNSPGGSYVGSDTIWRETMRAREAGKPIVVSMGNVAASGGYFVAMAAHKIVAQPGTITGSIGVLAGKPVMTGLMEKLGISFDAVRAGAHAGLFSTQRDFSPSEWSRFQAWLDRIYQDFTAKVAKGRKLPTERVLRIAKGRIWTGEAAKAHGLVDALGGVATAVKLARKAAGIPDTEEVAVRLYPEVKRSRIEDYLEMMQPDGPENSEASAGVALVRRSWEALRPWLRRLFELTRSPSSRALSAPSVEVR